MAVTVNLTLKKDKKTSDGKIPIYIRITENRKSRYLSTGISVKENEWNKRLQEIRKSHPLSVKLNEELTQLKLKSESKKSELRQKEKLDAKTLKRELETNKNISILEYAEEYKVLLKQQDRYWEHKHFKVLLNDIAEFGYSDAILNRIDLKFLESFRDYLFHKKKNGNNTVRKKMQRFKGFVSEALKHGYIKHDPYRNFPSIKRERASKSKLDVEQIEKIKSLDLSQVENLWHTRNYFMFSYYCAGIRFSDLCTLKPENIVDGRLRYSMKKTGTKKSIKLYPPALEILEYYNTIDQESYIFPILDEVIEDAFILRRQISSKNVLTNKWLKKIAEKAGIQEKVTFHIARHSFANLANKKGVGIYSLSKMLGHSDLKITETYLKSFDEELIDQEMDNIFN